MRTYTNDADPNTRMEWLHSRAAKAYFETSFELGKPGVDVIDPAFDWTHHQNGNFQRHLRFHKADHPKDVPHRLRRMPRLRRVRKIFPFKPHLLKPRIS